MKRVDSSSSHAPIQWAISHSSHAPIHWATSHFENTMLDLS
jgi:hypothetical protein